MKKLAVIFMLLFMFLLTGCGEIPDSQEKEDIEDMFVIIQDHDASHNPYDIVYNKDTKVMYAISYGAYNSGSFTVLVNPDGTPMIYEEESEDNE